jgi:hypothetical protein
VTGGPVWPAATVTPPEAAPVVPPVYAATQQAAPPPVYTPPPWAPPVYTPPVRPNDFDITYEELAGVTFTPAAQRMQGAQSRLQKGGRVNFKTIFMKGLLYGLIGGIVGWGIIELLGILDPSKVLGWMGYTLTGLENGYVNGVISYSQAYAIEFAATCIMSALFCGLLGGFIGAAMGAGEGIYYGSVERAVKYGLIGLGIALGIGLVGGYLAEILYMRLIGNATSATPEAYIAFARAIVWSVMGLGVGLAVGLIKPGRVRILCCLIGGFAGGFIGGFLFEFIAPVLSTGANDTGMLGRAIGITLMGLLIGLGIGLLEQFAKGAWLKVVRGEFEGKEYIVFAGVTSIGNNSRNTIVLFKDKLVAPSHCEIVLEGASYVLVDKGSPLGTIVNGMRVGRHTLRPGDAIAIGNSVLVFNTR